MAELDNDYIVKLEEVYEGETTFYIILEYLKGNSLHEIITKNGISSLSWDEIRSILWVFINNIQVNFIRSIAYAFLRYYASRLKT